MDWVEVGRGALPAVVAFGTALLVLRRRLPKEEERRGTVPPRRRAVGPVREVGAALVGGAAAGAAAGSLVALALGQNPLAGARILFLLASLIYLLALAACLSSWRFPLPEVVAFLLFVPALPLQLLVHAGVLTTPGGMGGYVLPPASFMVDLPAWATLWGARAGWNPLEWSGGLAVPGFRRGALVWGLHVGLLLGLASWGRHRRGLPDRAPGLRQTGK
ncbi:MAG: hypothetical protein EA350_04980 [Gemmatimonadales bacterium]|nr:MAG: hypothetical protein EA350_04980 [Gemmatimonadales bacterium]